MCGIAGIFITDGARPVDEGVLIAMGNSMAHRGPDGEGHWTSADHRVGLAHRRLSIVDLSDTAAQPMADADATVWVTFNGEIYNHLTLRRDLEKAGHRFRTDHSDTEVLVHGYKEWGIGGLVERLDGMFAFGLWDEEKKRLFIVRDRIGIKPVYFTRKDGTFRFASEIKAILADPKFPRDVEPAALNHYLSFMVAPAPLTMFKDIFKLPAGHILEVDGSGRLEARRYWDAVPGKGIDPVDTKGLSEAALEEFYATGILGRLRAGIDKRMMSDVPFGVFLSGGIDSSANVALMSQMMDRPVDTFTVGFKDHTHLNELDYAQRVATKFKTNHHEVLIDEGDMLGYLDNLVHHQDEPLADWVCVPLYFVSKLAKDSGVTVVQVGEGSDEQFAGYNSYKLYLQLHRRFWNVFKALPGPARHAAAALARGLSCPHTPRLDRIADILGRGARNQELFWGAAHAYWNIHKDRVLAGPIEGGPWPVLEEAGLDAGGLGASDSGEVISALMRSFDSAYPKREELTRMIHNEFKVRLAELLLMRVDKITMSTSIEGRVPFLDHGLVDFTMDIPHAWKIRGGEQKYILKKALAGILPDEILYRPKMGFGAPMAEWLRGDFGRQAENAVLGSPLMDRGYFNRSHIEGRFRDHRDGRRDNALHLWLLFNLTAWHDHWIGGT
ncbi:MAG: asparagine synthase (glutamine-hydrolyzing) [Rhodospirillales bacterium]|nr:asparagine synthase (glutamine-hydrolyzing) [Rhodospirillales bacterium]